MSAPQFTPGPWTASVEAKPFATGGHWYVVLDAEENGIGEFYGDDHEANVAHLYFAAAAPELYEALEALVECWPEGSIPNGPVCVQAAAALAKARGEA